MKKDEFVGGIVGCLNDLSEGLIDRDCAAGMIYSYVVTLVKNANMVPKENIEKLFKVLGFAPGNCRSCGAQIFWGVSKNGKNVPFENTGLAHFTTCQNADQHRKKKE